MDYITWIPLIHNIFVLILSTLTLISSTNVFFYKFLCRKCIKLIPVLQIYFFFQFFWSITSFTNTVYLVIFWRPNESLYNERLLYLFGVLPDTLLFLNSVMGIFLCIDRCLTISFPIKYGKYFRKILGYCTAVILLIIYGLALWQNKSFELIPENQPTTCYYRGCLVGSRTVTNYAQQKIVFSIMDILAGILLFVLIRLNFNRSNTSNKSKKLNVTALLIVISSTLFDFCPSLFYRFVPLDLEKPLSWYIGPYLITLGSFGVTLCAGIYANAFKSAKKNKWCRSTFIIKKYYKITCSLMKFLFCHYSSK